MKRHRFPWRGVVVAALFVQLCGCMALKPGDSYVHPHSGIRYTILRPHNLSKNIESPRISTVVDLELAESEKSHESSSSSITKNTIDVEDLGTDFNVGISWVFSPIKRIGQGVDGSVFVATYQKAHEKDADVFETRYAVVKVVPCNRQSFDTHQCSLALQTAIQEYNTLLSLCSFDPKDEGSYAGLPELRGLAATLTKEAGKRILKPVDKPFAVLVGNKKRDFSLVDDEEDIDNASRNAIIETFDMISPSSTPDTSVTLYTGMKQLYDDSTEIGQLMKPMASTGYTVVTMGRILLQTIYQVLQGAALISASKLIHRDIKGNNIVVKACSNPGTCSWSTAMEVTYIDFYNMVSCPDGALCSECKVNFFKDFLPVPLHSVWSPGYACPEGLALSKDKTSTRVEFTLDRLNLMCERNMYPAYSIDSFSLGVVLMMMMNMGSGFSSAGQDDRYVINQVPDIARYCLELGSDALDPDRGPALGLSNLLNESSKWKDSVRGIEYCWRDSITRALEPDFKQGSRTVMSELRVLQDAVQKVLSAEKSNVLYKILLKLLQCNPLARMSPMDAFSEFNREFVTGILEYDVYSSSSRSVRSGKRSKGASPVFTGNRIAAGMQCNSYEYTGCIFLEVDRDENENYNFGAVTFTIQCNNGNECVLESPSHIMVVNSPTKSAAVVLQPGSQYVIKHNDKISLCPNSGVTPNANCDPVLRQNFEWKFTER